MNEFLPDEYRWAKPHEVVAAKVVKPHASLRIIINRKGVKRLALPKR